MAPVWTGSPQSRPIPPARFIAQPASRAGVVRYSRGRIPALEFPMSRAFALASVLIAASLPACTWVKMEPGASQVRVVRMSDDLSSCTKRGEVGVSVRDKVALYQRNDLKVRDELETMARNEADALDADTVQALNEPSAGEQRFAAYRCGASMPVARAPVANDSRPRADGEAETFPVRED
jgi:hypothetical protein